MLGPLGADSIDTIESCDELGKVSLIHGHVLPTIRAVTTTVYGFDAIRVTAAVLVLSKLKLGEWI